MARRGYSKRLPSFFSKTARLLYRCRPPEPPWCFAARTGLLLMCRPAQRAMPTDFFRVGPFIIRVGLFIEGFDPCLGVNNFCHLLATANVSRSSEQ
jgi:hypothetical protein